MLMCSVDWPERRTIVLPQPPKYWDLGMNCYDTSTFSFFFKVNFCDLKYEYLCALSAAA